MLKIRNESPSDYQRVEDIARQAFYNLYIPGCYEHYLMKVMRNHEDFIPELDLVIELDDKVIGNIMYTKAKLIDEDGYQKDILTFGPVCIDPQYQRHGYGKQLITYSFEQAQKMGYDVVVIFGSPANYVTSGFQCCKRHQVCIEGNKYPSAMMVKELVEGALANKKWVYHDSPVMAIDETEAKKYDETLEKMEKKFLPSQEEFYIMSHSFIDEV